MKRLLLRAGLGSLLLCSLSLSCAIGAGGRGGIGGAGGEGEISDDASGSGGTSDAASSSSSSSAMSSSSSGMDPPECDPGKHLCGGICVGNTPQTGCYQSVACTPCPSVTYGTTTCTSDGLCDFTCTSPYQKSGNTCSCPMQCCSSLDCSGGQTCENGQCVTPCSDSDCLFDCVLMGYLFGSCQGGQCVCF